MPQGVRQDKGSQLMCTILRWMRLTGILALMVLASESYKAATQSDFKQVLTVCPEGPPQCDFAHIQEAVVAAQPGTILKIRPGLYEEHILIDKSLQIVGEPNARVQIRGSTPGRPAIEVRPTAKAEVLLQGLTIQGGPPAGERSPRSPRGICWNLLEGICPNGIFVEGNGIEPLLFTLLEVEISSPSTALVLSCANREGGPTEGIRTFIANSSFSRSANGVVWDCRGEGSQLFLVDSVLADNDHQGLGIVESSPQVRVERVTFVRNRVGTGAISLQQGNVDIDIRESQFLFNATGAELILPFDSRVEVGNSLFLGNDVGVNWGPVIPLPETYGSRLLIRSSELLHNLLYGLYIHSPEPADIEGSLIAYNGFGVVAFQADKGVNFATNRITRNEKWGIALFREECGIDAPASSLNRAAQQRVIILGKGNRIEGNGLGSLCPESYPWPEGFIASSDE